MDIEGIEYNQADFFGVFPGAAGGCALCAVKDSAYFRELARTAAGKRSKEARQAMATKAAHERRRRLYTIVRTVNYVELEERVTERIIPWWVAAPEESAAPKTPGVCSYRSGKSSS